MDTMAGSVSNAVTMNSEDKISAKVVSAVADAKGVDPLELDPLYDVIDADALDAIFGPTEGEAARASKLTFRMADCRVVVRGTGEVSVTTAPEQRGEAGGSRNA